GGGGRRGSGARPLATQAREDLADLGGLLAVGVELGEERLQVLAREHHVARLEHGGAHQAVGLGIARIDREGLAEELDGPSGEPPALGDGDRFREIGEQPRMWPEQVERALECRYGGVVVADQLVRSEERRVGKAWRGRRRARHKQKTAYEIFT